MVAGKMLPIMGGPGVVGPKNILFHPQPSAGADRLGPAGPVADSADRRRSPMVTTAIITHINLSRTISCNCSIIDFDGQQP